jgi:hypothetical protein
MLNHTETYGHLAPDAEAVELGLLNAYDTLAEKGPSIIP